MAHHTTPGDTLRRHVARQVILELLLPIGAYYGLRAAGVDPWVALVAPALLTLPFLVYDALRRRRVDAVALFTLTMLAVGTVVSLVTGDPRTLLVRDSWLFAAIGLWILATLFTSHPMMRGMARTIVTVKIGGKLSRMGCPLGQRFSLSLPLARPDRGLGYRFHPRRGYSHFTRLFPSPGRGSARHDAAMVSRTRGSHRLPRRVCHPKRAESLNQLCKTPRQNGGLCAVK